MLALGLSGCGVQEQPPVSPQVQKYYDENVALRPTATPAADAPKVPAVLTSAFTNPNALYRADSGQQFGVWDNGKNDTGLAVSGGRLVHGAASGKNAAGYLEAGISKPVEMIGADVVFSDPLGQVALVAWQNSIVAALTKPVPDRIPNGGIHFVAGSAGWHLGVYDTNGGERILAEGKLQLAADGKAVHKFTVVRKGDTAWIVLPSGATTPPIKDPKLAEWTGEWATWELFESAPATAPAAFTSVTAG